jgi:PTH1 family peptidyl-tRNA hydrolase
VLSKPSVSDRQQIENAIDDSLRVIDEVISGDLEKAMHKLHSQ